MAKAQRDCFGNPASQHVYGRRARTLLEDARDSIAASLGVNLAQGDRLVFTSGGTEANNLALTPYLKSGPPVLCSPFEHPSILAAVRASLGSQHDWPWPVTSSGLVLEDPLEERLEEGPTSLICCCLASGETGVLQPVSQVVAIGKKHKAPVHVDAVQAAGKLPSPFSEFDCASMAIGAHKFGGPRGIGALALRSGYQLQPVLLGGFQEQGLRAGTECVALAAGMAEALRLWDRSRADWSNQLRTLRKTLESSILSAVPSAVVHGGGLGEEKRLPHAANIAFPGVHGPTLLMRLDLAGVACSMGSACQSGSLEPSQALLAMGVPPEVALASLRFSLGWNATESNIAEAAQRIIKAVQGM